MNDQQKLERLLGDEQYMVLAITLGDGTPWAVPVRIKSRKGNMFEWDSSLAAEHSKAIGVKTSAAVTIFQKKKLSKLVFTLKARLS